MRHQYMGVATYSRSVDVPESFTAPGQQLFLIAERIERSAKLSAGGAFVAEHTGYMSRFEADVTQHVRAGRLKLALAVNATKNKGYDGLLGTGDLSCEIDFGGWGGIGSHVHLESRRTAAWIVDPHVQSTLSMPGLQNARVKVTITLGSAAVRGRPSPAETPPSPAPPRSDCPATFPFLDHFRSDICYKTKAEAAAGTGPCDSWCQKGVSPPAGCGQLCPGAGVVAATAALNQHANVETLSLRVEILAPDNSTSTHSAVVPCNDSHSRSCSSGNIQLQAPALWSPRSPMQYTAVIELLAGDGSTIMDVVKVRFGIRHLEKVGYHWKLNNEWLYLHGYGEDGIYPDTLREPTNHSLYVQHLQFAKSLGFNFARHHSTTLPLEFWDAACEVGLFMSAQFPIGESDGTDLTCPGDGCYGMLLHEWRAMVKQLRNHPCLFDYTIDNEDPLLERNFAMSLYNATAELDPGRFVNTADGAGVSQGKGCPDDCFGTAGWPNPQAYFAIFGLPIATAGPGIPQYDAEIGPATGFWGYGGYKGVPPVPVLNHETGAIFLWQFPYVCVRRASACFY